MNVQFNMKSGLCSFWALLAFLLLAENDSSASAQTVHDYATWFSVNAQGEFSEHHCDHQRSSRLRWTFDSQLRFLDDAGGYHQGFCRPGLGYTLNPSTSVWIGYAWVDENPASRAPSFKENRLWQQLSWSKELAQSKISFRTRLEQRWLETGDDVGWRFRHQGRLERPLVNMPRLSLILTDEAFFDLNETDWGANGSFSQNRAFVGLGIKFEGEHQPKLEVGYLHQYFRRIGAGDRHHHAPVFNWFWSF